jgi:hypothetical protein
MSLVSLLRPSGCAGQAGVRFQVSEKDDRVRIRIILKIIRFLTLTPDPPPAEHLKPVWLEEKIDRLNPNYINYL